MCFFKAVPTQDMTI